jgi:hypothetical protein
MSAEAFALNVPIARPDVIEWLRHPLNRWRFPPS